MSIVRLFVTLAAVAPAVAQWGPLPGNVAPPATASAPMCYDLLRGRTMLLPGAGYGGMTPAQTWVLDANGWSQLHPAVQAPVRDGAAMSIDLIGGGCVLYGGVPSGLGSTTSYPSVDETWSFDGSSWTQLAPAQTPGGLARFGIATDLGRGRVVVFGGIRNVSFANSVSNQTWEWDGVTWQQPTFVNGPEARQRVAMCYSAGLARTVLFGGQGPTSMNDETWLYDGSQWTAAPVTGPRPAPRVDAVLIADDARGVCLLVGGQDPVTMEVFDETWEFNGAQWRLLGRQASPPRTRAMAAFDYTRAAPVLFGGRTATTALLDDTWRFGANHAVYGQGCLGTFGRPTVVPGLAPRLGAVASARLVNLDPAAGVAVMTIGYSRTHWAYGSLPTSLAFVGMPGCVAYASADEIQLVGAAGGTATWSSPVPAAPELFGLQVHLQGLSFDPARNAAGFVASNGDTLTLGW
jgi:hypothetical protein